MKLFKNRNKIVFYIILITFYSPLSPINRSFPLSTRREGQSIEDAMG
jgi:hypothetical protein